MSWDGKGCRGSKKEGMETENLRLERLHRTDGNGAGEAAMAPVPREAEVGEGEVCFI